MTAPVRVMCIGGSDSGGGAGIQADLKTVTACGCYGTSVITALTAQNSLGVQDILPVPAKFIAAQIDSVLGDIGTDAVKTGMLLTRGAVDAVVKKVMEYRLKNIVVDPVMIAKGGRMMMEERARRAVVEKLLPLARVVTPNIPEAEAITGLNIRSVEGMKKAAALILSTGVKNVVVKGGHLPGCRKAGGVDVLYDGAKYHEYHAEWISTKNTHGTGCTFASALAAGLAQRKCVSEAVKQAKMMVTKAIEHSLTLGKGYGPVNISGKRHEQVWRIK